MNEKTYFNQQPEQDNEILQPKRAFDGENIDIEMEPIEPELILSEVDVEPFEPMLKKTPSRWKGILIGILMLFLSACVAQTLQWLIDSWQQQQWIYFTFAIVACLSIGVGISALFNEWRILRKLRARMALQQKSQQLFTGAHLASQTGGQNSESFFDIEQAQQLCLKVSDNLGLDPQHPWLNNWQQQIQQGQSINEIAYLFSQNVLKPIDQKGLKMISQSAVESAIVVAISPLALVDMLFLAWRNIRLVNQIAQLYGVELGYFSRLKLFKLVLTNVAFAGATELVQEIGMDWLSQDIAAKLSARAAQGIGVGLLTARLGIKAIEFCRPMPFQPQEKPSLQEIHRHLLGQMKKTLLSTVKSKEKATL